MYTFLIRGARVLDGAGGPEFQADVAVAGDRIAEVGTRLDTPAERTLDADGLVLAPGFIDIHSHTDLSIFERPLAESKLLQGVTLEVTGNCGIGAFPVEPRNRNLLAEYLTMHEGCLPEDGLAWADFASYAARLDRLGLGVNLAPLVAHGALRIAAMGAEDRSPDAGECDRMGALLDLTLRHGAWGMSTGLIYPPGSFAKTDEVIALSRVLARRGALYASHIRGEGDTVLESMDEAVRIGRESGARVQVSHLKALGQRNWGRGREALARLEAARRAGVDVGADQYPYTATSTSLSALVPAWAHAGGVAELLKRLADPALAERLRGEIGQLLHARGGPARVAICRAGSARNAHLSGKTLEAIAQSWSLQPEAAVIKLLLEERGTLSAVYFSLADEDVDAIMAADWVAVGSDGRGMSATHDADAATHPRSYGTFPRVLGRYVRERGLLSLAAAVCKMTDVPAARLGLADRGVIRPGYAADLVLFDPATVLDRADFQRPHQYPVGVEHVFVNGRPAVLNGRLSGETPGRVLRRQCP
jgi:N-acyl-D-amino-acid deacylase